MFACSLRRKIVVKRAQNQDNQSFIIYQFRQIINKSHDTAYTQKWKSFVR